MHLHNLRFRFANNSSSSHSLILVSNDEIKNLRDEDGWGNFLLVSKEAKSEYLGIMLYNEIKYMIPDDVAKILFKDSLNIALPDKDYYIDHQSHYVIPRDMKTGFIHWEFFNEFAKQVLKKNIVIEGGNDNDGYESFLTGYKNIKGRRIELSVPQDENSNNFVARKDRKYDYWVLFNKVNGTKIRFSFDKQINPQKSNFPELVDMKITNNCSMGCKYCYQNSTPDGKHADYYEILRIIDSLADFEVFEIAFGGGEVFNHPNFIEILKYTKSKGITPNFSTRNIKWLENDLIRSEVLDNCGSFAYSIDNELQIERLGDIFNYFNIPKEKVSIQLAMGTLSSWQFEQILRSCHKKHFSLTLLGFKNVGRGDKFKKTNYSWMIQEINKARTGDYKDQYCPSISMDTVLVSEFKNEIEKMKIPEYMYHTEEGKFSCYIDCVDKKIGPSSFCDEKDMVSFPVSPYNKDYRSFEGKWFVNEYSKF